MERYQNQIKNLNRNCYYSNLLQELYSGKLGIICFELQCDFQINYLNSFANEMANFFVECLNVVKEVHSILFSLILKHGGKPKLIDSKRIWFSGKNLCYDEDLKLMIESNISFLNQFLILCKFTKQKIRDIETNNSIVKIVNLISLALKILKNLYNKA